MCYIEKDPLHCFPGKFAKNHRLYFLFICCFQKSLCNVEISACLWLYMAAAEEEEEEAPLSRNNNEICKKFAGLKLQFAATSLNMAAAAQLTLSPTLEKRLVVVEGAYGFMLIAPL